MKKTLLKILRQQKDMGRSSFPPVQRRKVTVPQASESGREKELGELRKISEKCHKCPLIKSRINFVFGEGHPGAGLMFVGEGPGYEEDRQGRPFVGRSGQLLTKIIEAMKMKREEVYITNIAKCHPVKDPLHPESRGNDRPPSPEETAACFPILLEQIRIIRPEIICCLGASASQAMLRTEKGITSLRGRFYPYKPFPEEAYTVEIIPTYHPAYLLRNPAAKKDCWKDMQMIMEKL
ncbi:MAG TPA: uracil-DNA glycosylase [bacterium]|nr:uracil-DNA glycosylase [bacterium]